MPNQLQPPNFFTRIPQLETLHVTFTLHCNVQPCHTMGKLPGILQYTPRRSAPRSSPICRVRSHRAVIVHAAQLQACASFRGIIENWILAVLCSILSLKKARFIEEWWRAREGQFRTQRPFSRASQRPRGKGDPLLSVSDCNGGRKLGRLV
jgi:hypothetical protein